MRRLHPAFSTAIIGLFSTLGVLGACSSNTSGDPVASDAGSTTTSSGSTGSPGSSGSPGEAGTSGAIDSGTSGTSGSSGSSGSSGQVEAGVDSGGTCNNLAQQGLTHDGVTATAALPTGAGGGLTDGTWLRTAEILHTQSFPDGHNLGPQGASTWVLAGTDLEIVNTDTMGAVDHRSLTVTPNGNQLVTTSVCISPPPASTPAAPQITYTADPTTLKLFVVLPGGAAGSGIEYHFTKK